MTLNNHQKDWENIKKELDSIKKIYGMNGNSLNINENNWNDVRKAFTEVWNENRIKNMTLEEYTDTNRQYAFTYWIENVLDGLGNIKGGGTSIKFGIYKAFGNIPERYNNDGSYVWKKSFNGDSSKEAFNEVKKVLINIIKFAQEGNLSGIDLIKDISPIFKWKIAFLYNNSNIGNNILSIFSYDKLVEICIKNKLNINKNETYTSIYNKLIILKPSNKNIIEYSNSLWGGYTCNKKLAIYQISKTANKNAIALYYSDKLNGIDLFFWDKKKFINMNKGDIVYFINHNKDSNFKILETEIIYNNGILLFKDDYGYKLISEDKEYDIDNNDNNLAEFIGKEFVIFEIKQKITNDYSIKGWRGLGNSLFTYIKDKENDDRLNFILDKTEENEINEYLSKKNILDIDESIKQNILSENIKIDYENILVDQIESDTNVEEKGEKNLNHNYSSRKSDNAKKALTNIINGKRGEEIVMNYEKYKFDNKRIKYIPIHKSEEEGDGLGYDILSYDNTGNKKYIEVKSINKSYNGKIEFNISPNELRVLKEKPNSFIYMVYNIYKNPKIVEIQITNLKGDLVFNLDKYCEPSNYICSFRKEI